MDIIFSNSRLAKVCNSRKEMEKVWGTDSARKLMQRLTELAAAETLQDISHLPPPRCHELDGKREVQFAVDTKQPYRLIFKPNHKPVPRKADGGIDRSQVTSICVIEVVNYHGK